MPQARFVIDPWYAYTMDPVKRDMIVEALRSGKFQQGYGRLVQGGKGLGADGEPSPYRYCCLGVISELAVRAGHAQSQENLGCVLFSSASQGWGFGLWERYLLHPAVVQWMDLREDGQPTTSVDIRVKATCDGWFYTSTPESFREGQTLSLSKLNDSLVPFTEIADIIKTIPANPTD